MEPEIIPQTEPVEPLQFVTIDITQYDKLIQSIELLTNRFEFLLLLFIFTLGLLLFNLMRSK